MQPLKRILSHELRVHDLSGVSEFYCNFLGMQVFEENADMLRLGYHDDSCHIVFHRKDVSGFVAQPMDFYWKIGITLPDLDATVDFLQAQGGSVSQPVQFRDIGYMSKIADPNGLVIELLQHGFDGNAKPSRNGHAIGNRATLAHITLRVTDIGLAKQFFGEKLGMRLMSVQPVDEHGFCLYFYTWSEEELPEPALRSVKNREWLWARPYTFIELQHLLLPDAAICKSAPDASGFDGFSFGGVGANDATFVSIKDLDSLK